MSIPTSVKLAVKKKKPDDPGYVVETARILANRKKPENQQPHEFEAAEWTHKNGHPRCIRCGEEESDNGMCEGYRPPPAVKAAADYAPGLPSKSDMGHADKLRVGQLLDYIIQHHKAERAGPHYDVRFGNLDTGLLSWASRKGVPAPGEKHLAVQQPVHRHEYKDFEGEIPEGYGKGTVKKHTEGQVLITKVTPESIHFTTAHQRHPERFTLARPKGWDRNWLLMNTTPRDQVPYEKVRYKKIPPEQVEPHLQKMQEGDTVEAKVDGASQLIRLAKDSAEAMSFRTSKVTGGPIIHTERLFGGRPEIKVPPHLEGSVLKGEAYASPGPGRAGTAQDVGTLLNSSIARSLQLQKERGLTLRNMLYDVQRYGKTDIDPAVTPRADRRKMLEEIAAHLPQDKFHVSEEAHGPEAATKLWNLIRSGGHGLTQEGIIHHPKVGIPAKTKMFEEHDVHLRDVFPGEGKRQKTVGGFRYSHTPTGPIVGKVGSGFSDPFLAEVARDPSAYIGRVARLKAQEKFGPSGALRAPVFLGLHEDYPNKPGGSFRKTGSDLARTEQTRIGKALVDLPLCLREHQGYQEHGVDWITGDPVMRLPAQRTKSATTPNARNVEDARLSRMVCHGPAVHPSKEQGLSQLRWAGDQDLSKVADIHELLRGYGSSSEGQAPGAAREQRAIQSLELLLGDTAGTVEKQAHQPSAHLLWGNADIDRLGRTDGHRLQEYPISDRQAGLVGRAGTDHTDPTHAQTGSDHSRWRNAVGFGLGQASWNATDQAPLAPGTREAIPGSDTSVAKLAGFIGPSPADLAVPDYIPVNPALDRRRRKPVPPPPPSWWEIMRNTVLGGPNAIVPEIVQQIEQEEEKAAAVLHGALADLKRAKFESDRGNYAAKHRILSRLFDDRPSEFVQDSTGRGVVGLTHKPTGFKIHAPIHVVRGRVKAADWVRSNTSTLPDGRVLDIDKLIGKTVSRKIERVPIDDVPKPSRSSATGYSKARQAKVDMSKPVIVGHDGTLYDGRHRLFRHIDEGKTHIHAVRVSDADIDDVTICDDCKPQGDKIDKNRIEMLPAKAAALVKLADLLPWVHLQPQQERVAKKVREGQNLLVYHGLGSGKSLAGIAAAEGVGGPYTAVVPASLRPNYEGEIGKFSDQKTPSEVMSYTGVGMGRQPKQDPDTVIMDEVQRLRNPDSEASQAAMDLAMRAKHRVLLSGTPIVNAPSDLAVPLSILTGDKMSPASFNKKFVGTKTVSPGFMGWLQGVQPAKVPTLKDEQGLERLLENHVDYQPSRTPEGVKTKDERVEVDLSPEQQDFYKLMWGKLPWTTRWKLSNDYPLTGPELTHLSSFMTGPRQAALSLYPYHSSKDPMRAFHTSSKLQSAMGSLKETLARNPKAKALVYSNFIDAGLTPYAAALQAEGIPYGQFHGTMTEEDRKRALADYNEGRSRVLLLGPAAAEGISAKGTQLIQLLDPHWNEARLGQARGRGLRFDSHEGLPPELRDVKIQRFVSKMPKPGWLGRLFGAETRPSADEVLEQQSKHKEELNEQFREVLRRVGAPGYQRPWSLFG